ncbi:MAG TPA: hypothetical protein VJ829_05805 [Candidatus Binatia bacterium]|nr:hypothetical protein [Candidatus Binatia bacterium]
MARDPHGTLLHAALGTVVFVVLVPGSVVVLGPWLPDWLARRDAAARLARDALARRDLLVLALPLLAAFNLRFVVEDHGNGAGSCSERS